MNEEYFNEKPAKLNRLRNAFILSGYDTDFTKYIQIGMIESDGAYDNRLQFSLKHGIILSTEMPNHYERCHCGQEIIRNCIIKHSELKYVLVIGSCCYMGLTNKTDRKKMCSIDKCGQRHANVKYSLCNKHKEEAIKINKQKQKEIKMIGNQKYGFGKTFKDTLIKDVPLWHLRWIRFNGIDCDGPRRLIQYHKLISQS
jgi:hypothetical protein